MKKMISDKISVLMSVYKNDRPDYFCLAVDSVLQQTLKPDEIILVVDGPISQKLEVIIKDYSKKVNVIWLKKNKGLWNALNVGLRACRNELIARMDSDDIATPDRLEKQIAAFRQEPDLDIVGAQIAEFLGDTDNIVSYRKVPLAQAEIVKFARFRSPFNHPVVMYKKSAVLAVGGYSELYRTEDYDLWIRMLNHGCQVKNLQELLLFYRLSDANMARKTNAITNKEMRKAYRSSYKIGFLNWFEYVLARVIREVFYYMPKDLKNTVYTNILRREKK